MIKLTKEQYHLVLPLVKSNKELSVISVLKGITTGAVFVNDATAPSSALIQTCECNLLAGIENNLEFNAAVKEHLDFWDQLTPDTDAWLSVITDCHPNQFIRAYQRRRYLFRDQQMAQLDCPNGFEYHPLQVAALVTANLDNTEPLIEWAANYETSDFAEHGLGAYLVRDKQIVAWSLSDCSYQNKVAIGIQVSTAYRQQGLGKYLISQMLVLALQRGFKEVEWTCVDFNKGSIALAEAAGFEWLESYTCFTSYPPCENILDLSEAEWANWADYYAQVSHKEPRLLVEQLYAYMKANELAKATKTLERIKQTSQTYQNDLAYLADNLAYFNALGMSSDFNQEDWRKATTF